MTTTTNLCKILAFSLGLDPDLVLEHAHHLHEASGDFPIGEDGTEAIQARPEHAAKLLIAVMSGVEPAKAPDAVRLYSDLPLECARRGGAHTHGGWVNHRIPDDEGTMETLAAWGETFGEHLVHLIACFNQASEVNAKVGSFILGDGLGTATAYIYLEVLIAGEDVVVVEVAFSLIPLGGGAVPDDAPRCRLNRRTMVKGEILLAFREFFTSAAGGPREVFIPLADWPQSSREGSL